MCSHCKEGAGRTKECSSEPKNIPLAGRICLLFIKGYQYCISPLFPPCCRYTPTCSQYAVEAVSRYGAVKGVWFALCRILRCHPFARGGYDPVK